VSKYAKDTEVSVERSKIEIEKLLRRYGATSFVSGWEATRAAIRFDLRGKRIKFVLPLPDRDHYRQTETGRNRFDEGTIERAWEQGCRSRWRALALVLKAKLEAVDSGISLLEEEFLSWVEMPNGKTIGETILGQVESAYRDGKMPPLLGVGT
jgi:hypothetical protein